MNPFQKFTPFNSNKIPMDGIKSNKRVNVITYCYRQMSRFNSLVIKSRNFMNELSALFCNVIQIGAEEAIRSVSYYEISMSTIEDNSVTSGGKGHHVVCLIKCGEQVVPTKLVSTVVHNTKNPDTDLRIPGDVVLNNIYSDFTVTFEVYCLQAQEEFLPHEVKYHINKKSGNKLVTPKKSKQESRMIMPIRESPAGPHAVRTSSFAVMGYIVFSVQAVNKKIWSLNNTPSMSPLDGTVQMRICCELAVSVEHRGFLTMFEDVAGFGAWHRRWVVLKGDTFSYWKYPDDEKKMAPIDTIDLKNCITQKVGPVSRDICARLHTFLIERERVARPKDKDSLVTICKGDKTIIRHLLSADTKDDRIQWCDKFNAALTALRMWGSSRQ